MDIRKPIHEIVEDPRKTMAAITLGGAALFGVMAAAAPEARPLAVITGTVNTIINAAGWYRIRQNMRAPHENAEVVPITLNLEPTQPNISSIPDTNISPANT